MARREQVDQRGRDIRILRQCIHHRIDGEPHAGLAQIAVKCPQPVCLRRAKSGFGHKAVEHVVFGLTVEHGGNRSLDRFCALYQFG